MTFNDSFREEYRFALKAAKANNKTETKQGLQKIVALFDNQYSQNNGDAISVKSSLSHWRDVFCTYIHIIDKFGLSDSRIQKLFGIIVDNTSPSISGVIKGDDEIRPSVIDTSGLFSYVGENKTIVLPIDTDIDNHGVKIDGRVESIGGSIERGEENLVSTTIGGVNEIENNSKGKPETLEDFIGQVDSVKQIKEAITYAKMMGNKCIFSKQGGVLFLGNKGLGKTTLMWLTAKEMGIPKENFFYIEASMLQNNSKSQKILTARLEAFARKGEREPVVLCIDEIHRLNTSQQSMLLTLLESRKYCNQTETTMIEIPVNEFTLMGATTDEHDLLDTIYNRFEQGLICKLVDYTFEQLKQIIIKKVAAHKIYPVAITDEAITEMINRSRSSLRVIEGLIQKSHQKTTLQNKTIIDKTITDELFDELKIDKTGLYAKDIEILQALKDAPNKTLSEENLANMVNLKLRIFQEMHKPYLVHRGFILSDNRGQSLTEKAIEYLNDSAYSFDDNVASKANYVVAPITNELPIEKESIVPLVRDISNSELQNNILDLLTGKFCHNVVKVSVLAQETGVTESQAIEILKNLQEQRLITLEFEGVTALMLAYEKLERPFYLIEE